MALHTYRLVITGSLSNQFWQNILHYQFDDGGYGSTEAAGLALCNAWNTANMAGYRSILTTTVKIMSLKARALNSVGGFEALLPFTPFLTGVIGGTVQVSGVGPLVILLPINNQKQRGRMFLPGIADTDCVDGILTTGYIGTFNAAGHIFADTLSLTGGGSPTATPVVYSKGPPPVSRKIQYAKLSPLVATQRRRQKPT
jgi:hypothetical protein